MIPDNDLRARSARPSVSELGVVGVTCGALLVAYWSIFGRLLPVRDGFLGGDYSYFLPALLNGYYWFRTNGLLAVPWFTPAICGGVPWFPNPESFYYSLPQFLTFAVDPLTAVQATFLVFAALGFLGTYVLLRRSFGLSVASAQVGAALFLFNGYYAHRMLVGHLGFHAFMLAPWIAHFAVRGLPRGGREVVWRLVIDALGVGACLAYMIHSGDHNLIVGLIAAAAVGLMRVVQGAPLGAFAARLVGGGLVAGLLSAAKLGSGIAYLALFPRDYVAYYGATGGPSPGELLHFVGRSLFLTPVSLLIQGPGFLLNRPEFEYGVSLVPAVVLGAFLARGAWAFVREPRLPARPTPLRAAEWAALVLVLAVPLAVNFYTPGWHAFLKTVPIVRSVNVLLRWLAAYILVLAVLTALALERMTPARLRRIVAAVAVVAVVALNATTSRRAYYDRISAAHGFDPAPVLAAYAQARSAPPPPIAEIARQHPLDNAALTQGVSPIRCYEAIFGYELQWFPPTGLRPGPALAASDGRLNVLDPACFVFPGPNACAPGDRFPVAERERAAAFLAYRATPFRRPVGQRVAETANLLALVAVPIVCLAHARRRQRAANP